MECTGIAFSFYFTGKKVQKVEDEWLEEYFPVVEVPGSNLDPKTSCLD
jgi:hypothetical protein